MFPCIFHFVTSEILPIKDKKFKTHCHFQSYSRQRDKLLFHSFNYFTNFEISWMFTVFIYFPWDKIQTLKVNKILKLHLFPHCKFFSMLNAHKNPAKKKRIIRKIKKSWHLKRSTETHMSTFKCTLTPWGG